MIMITFIFISLCIVWCIHPLQPGEGSLLPLWRMVCETAKKRAVTALAWCPAYFDLFAVGYGSYDYLRQTGGMVAVFSLKNPSHSEYEFETPSG
jgi:dynein intermediate chain 1